MNVEIERIMDELRLSRAEGVRLNTVINQAELAK